MEIDALIKDKRIRFLGCGKKKNKDRVLLLEQLHIFGGRFSCRRPDYFLN